MKSTYIALLLIFTLNTWASMMKEPCSFTVDLAVNDVSCPGGGDGSIFVNVNGPGGVGNYSFNWNVQGLTGNVVSGLDARTYFVDVTNLSTGCVVTTFATVEEPEPFESNFFVENAPCFGTADGSIDLTISGGTPPYQYSWSNGDVTEDIPNAAAGKYTITVIDNEQCTHMDSTTVTQPDPLTLAQFVTPVSCDGGSDGSIDLTVAGGTPIYRYRWNTPRNDTLEDVFQLPAGNYTVTVTDRNGCTISPVINVPEPEPLSVSFEVTPVSCQEGNDGEIIATVNGGNFPYRYTWSDEQVVLGEDSEVADSLTVGKYKLLISDDKNCQLLDSTDVTEPSLLILNLTKEDATCFGYQDGSIDLSVSGGSEPYVYQWSTGATTQDLPAIPSGDYFVVVADSNGCTGSGEIFVGQPTDLNIGASVFEVSCKDNDDGEIDLQVNGSVPPYSFSWDNGGTDQDLQDLLGGNYTVLVTDEASCFKSATFTVPVNEILCLRVPTAFSPNGDAINDTWEIINSDLYPEIHVRLFNRWGQVILEEKGYTDYWDGIRNGSPVPSGTYYYIVDPANGDKPLTGSLTIKR